MRYLTRFTCLCLVVLTIYPYSYAQVLNEENLWRKRALALTDDLLTDAGALKAVDRALLWTRLAHIWWKQEPDRARPWLQKTIEIVTASSDSETAAERQQRLKVARIVFPTIVGKDKSLSARLTQMFTSIADRLDKSELDANAQALGDAALSVLETDPQRAAELGRASLQMGRTHDLTSLLWSLRSRNSQLADSLLNEALRLAQSTYDKELLGSLVMVSFPQAAYPSFKGPIPPDPLRIRLLNILADGLLRHSSSAEFKAPACPLASVAAPLASYFYNLLPQRAGAVRNAVTECQPLLSTTSRQRATDSLRDLPLKTVEDYLEAVEKAPNLAARIDYWMRATFLAKDQQQYDRAISILDGMSIEARETLGETWRQARWDFAVVAALNHLKGGDLYAMQQVINTTPSRLQPLVQVYVAEKLMDAYPGNALEFIREARQQLNKVEIGERTGAYILMIRLYTKLLPQDAPNVLNEAVAAINRASSFEDELWEPISLPAALYEIDEGGLRLALASIESPTKRVAMRIGLLASLVERNPTNTAPKERTTARQGKSHGTD
jgi:tetratricopeptide (TPR) repeat protein